MRMKSVFSTAVFFMSAAAVFSCSNEVLALPAGYPSLEKFAEVRDIVREKCMGCHTRDYDLPFYAKLPGIRSIIEKDYKDGFRAMNLNAEFEPEVISGPVSEATLAKVEWGVANDAMPPARFCAIYLASRISAKEKQTMLNWVRATREAHYATGTAAKSRANEPLQPLPEIIPVNLRKAELGQKLFNDKRLTGDESVSCASCHIPERAFSDNQRFPSDTRKQTGEVNTPTLLNAVFNMRQFYNGRALEPCDITTTPPFAPASMAGRDWEKIASRFNNDEELRMEFDAVYSEGFSGKAIASAILEYEKTLITPGGRFDQWLKGKDEVLSDVELEGYQRFKTHKCVTCHMGKSVGGQSFEYMDLKGGYFSDRGFPLGSDEGLKSFTGKLEDRHKFKVPNLRNVELTWPYMHDGTVVTLDEAVRVMGVYLCGTEISDTDRGLITAFLRTLTGTFRGAAVEGKPIAR